MKLVLFVSAPQFPPSCAHQAASLVVAPPCGWCRESQRLFCLAAPAGFRGGGRAIVRRGSSGKNFCRAPLLHGPGCRYYVLLYPYSTDIEMAAGSSPVATLRPYRNRRPTLFRETSPGRRMRCCQDNSVYEFTSARGSWVWHQTCFSPGVAIRPMLPIHIRGPLTGTVIGFRCL